MDIFRAFVEKDVKTWISESESFEIGDIKYSIVITKLAWYACRLYCSYPLKIHKQSALYKAIQKRNYVPWEYSYFSETDDTITYEKVEYKVNSQHMTLEGAKSKLKELTDQCHKLVYDGSKNYPTHYAYFSQFCSPDEKNLVDEVNLLLGPCAPGFEVPQKEIINEKMVDKLINRLLFYGANTPVLTRDNEVYCLEYYGVPLVLIFSRTFFHMKEVQRTNDADAHTSLRPDYSLYKVMCCYVKTKNDTFELVRKSDNLDVSFLQYLVDKEWEKVFEPKIFYDNFTTTIVHKGPWHDVEPDKLNQLFQLGSILRVERKNGVYYHACVYLGFDLIIHVAIEKVNSTQQKEIFQFDSFEKFLADDSVVEEIRFVIPRFDKDQLYSRALEMNKELHLYKLSENNCEHLASRLTTGIKYSLQLGSSLKRLAAGVIGETWRVWNGQ